MKKTLKEHGKKVLIDSLVGAVIGTIIVYVIIGPFNATFVEIMQAIENKGMAIEASLIMFPAILVIYIVMNLAIIVVKENK